MKSPILEKYLTSCYFRHNLTNHTIQTYALYALCLQRALKTILSLVFNVYYFRTRKVSLGIALLGLYSWVPFGIGKTDFYSHIVAS